MSAAPRLRALLTVPLVAGVLGAAYAGCGLPDEGSAASLSSDGSEDAPYDGVDFTYDAGEESRPADALLDTKPALDGAADAADSTSDAHPADTGQRADTGHAADSGPPDAAAACADAGGILNDAGACTLACPPPPDDAGGGHPACPVNCPPGLNCVVDCSTANVCKGDVTCSGGAGCTIDCSSSSCMGDVTCSSGACSITCSGSSCMGNVACDAGSCSIACSGSACMEDVTCTTPGAPPGVCVVTCGGSACMDEVCCNGQDCPAVEQDCM